MIKLPSSLFIISLAISGCRADPPMINPEINNIPLRTECVGRALIDLPVNGTKSWIQNFDRADVIRISKAPKSKEVFWEDVEFRKKELENSPHATEFRLLSEFKKVNENAALLLYRENEAAQHGYRLDRFLLVDNSEYLFRGSIAGEEKSKIDSFVAVFNKFMPRDSTKIPDQPGFCIDGALIDGVSGDVSTNVTVDIIQWKNVSLWVGGGEGEETRPSNDLGEQEDFTADGFLDRERKAIRDTAAEYPEALQDPAYPKDFDVLRQHDRALNGFMGREVVWRKRLNNGAVIYTFRWETTGVTGTIQHPGVTAGMDVGKDEYPILEVPPEEKLFALWDAVLESLKPRPGAR